MKKELKIFCTSSLASSGSAWKKIKKNYKVNFEEFVDLNNPNFQHKLKDINYFIIFVEDLIENLNGKYLNTNILDTFYKKIKKTSKSNGSFIILSFLYKEKKHPINFAKFENFEKKFLNKIKEKYFSFTKKNDNLFYLDLETTFNDLGNNQIYDPRNWYSFRLRINKEGLNIISEDLQKLLKVIFTPQKKAIIIDCDNTIWGGVVGEDGVEHLKLGTDGEGKAYKDFQKILKSISDSGVILCLASKNNERDVWNVFKHHPEMILKKKDITLAFINWNEKSENLKKISKKLNINMDSFVFIDDNPLERDLIKKLLPQVEVLDMPEDVSYWSNFIYQTNLFSNLNKTSDDKNKKKQYVQKLKFDADIEKHKNKKNFLKKINLQLKIEKLSKYHFSRASQMTIKTNQFNFTSRRYSVNEIMKLNKKKNYFIYILKLNDSYGDHGYVSLILIEKNKSFFLIKNFLTSCRILGREVEKQFLKLILKKIVEKKYKSKVFIEFIPSERNDLAKKFIKDNKFKILNQKEKKMFNLSKKSSFYSINNNL